MAADVPTDVRARQRANLKGCSFLNEKYEEGERKSMKVQFWKPLVFLWTALQFYVAHAPAHTSFAAQNATCAMIPPLPPVSPVAMLAPSSRAASALVEYDLRSNLLISYLLPATTT